MIIIILAFVQISVTSIQVNENSNLPNVAVHLLSLPPQPRHLDTLPNGARKGRRPPVSHFYC